MDEVRIGDVNGEGKAAVAYSCRIVADAVTGEHHWVDPTWHGQQALLGKLRDDVPGLQIAFTDREYRHSGHMMHGAWLDVRDGAGNRLWDRRFVSMHPVALVEWLPGSLDQVCALSDLQRFPPRPSLQISDGRGVLVDVLPIINSPQDVRGILPRGVFVADRTGPDPNLGESLDLSTPHEWYLDVYGSGRVE